ncbi:MAG TPA: GAF domain-containing SpoIIE family protein phosphatase, partial [Acidimicrobiales bacterium]
GRLAEVHALQERHPYDPESATGVAHVIRTGDTEYYRAIPQELVDAATDDPDLREMIRGLALNSAICVPLTSGGRVLGGMQLVQAESGRRYDAADVALAEAVGGRIGAWLDNVELYQRQRHIARVLQASLLPRRLPVMDPLEVAVRYWAAGEGTEVGGDFYDLVELEPGAWAAVIGDVCGKGPEAAAVTSLARYALRTALHEGADAPAALARLNRSLLDEAVDRFCTVAVALLRPDVDGTMLLSVGLAGHPPPLVRRTDGTIEAIGEPAPPAGLFDQLVATPTQVRLEPGDVVLLHTDGITDVPPPRTLSDAELRDLLGDAAAAGRAEDIAARLGTQLDALLPMAERTDDIALVVLRLPPAE